MILGMRLGTRSEQTVTERAGWKGLFRGCWHRPLESPKVFRLQCLQSP